MSKFDKFEDILVWQRARELVNEVYRATSTGKFNKDFGLRDQIRRAALSTMLNIAEGFARRTNKEFAQFLFVAHGSVAEVQSALYVALDQHYVSTDAFSILYKQCTEISQMLTGLIKYLRST